MEESSFEINTPDLGHIHRERVSERIEMLEIKVAMLKELAHELNPYEEMDEQMKDRLSFFGITEFYDPFYITNQLLLLLENNLEKLEQLKSNVC